MNDFISYIWYLLTTPFKRVRKDINLWFSWCRAAGKRFDHIQAAVFRAREESMIATCSPEMLPVHAADRNLTRYTGESTENFRARLAMHSEVCRLGGSNAGIILAVKTLGFENPYILTAKEFKGDADRWAEFYLILPMSVEDVLPIGFHILVKHVRKWKEVGAKDNYYFNFHLKNSENTLKDYARVVFRLCLKNTIRYNNRMIIRFLIENKIQGSFSIEIKNNLWYLDGTYLLDGSKILNAYHKREELI